MLAARTFPGPEDAGRLARLALTATDEAEAADLLARAEALAAGDADVSYCRGRHLAARVGRVDAAAARRTAALAARPDDLALRWQLAECYRRAGAPEQAINTWMPGGDTATPDFAWLRAWFWNRVTRPVARDWESNAPNSGPLQQMAGFLLDLPADQFWDTESSHGHFTRGAGPPRQETQWLRLLALLQAGREAGRSAKSASQEHVPRASPGSPTWRTPCSASSTTTGPVTPQRPATPAMTRQSRHPFFEQLELLAADGNLSAGAAGLPDDVARLLGSKEVFSAALFMAGWTGRWPQHPRGCTTPRAT